MLFESTFKSLHLPGPNVSLADLLLEYPYSHRTSQPLFFHPSGLASGSSTTTSPIYDSLSLDGIRKKAFELTKVLLTTGRNVLEGGENVILFRTNRHDYIASVLGICLAGGKAVLVDSATTTENLAELICTSQAKHTIACKAEPGADKDDCCLVKAKKAIALLPDGREHNLVEMDEVYETALEMSEKHGKGKESEEWRLQRKAIKGSDIAVMCFRRGKAVEYSHSNLIAAVIQETFTLRDLLNEPLNDGREYNPVGESGWYDEAEDNEQHLALPPQLLSSQRVKSSNIGTSGLEEDVKEGLEQKSLFRLLRRRLRYTRKSQLRIESRPEGQRQFHIDYSPQWDISALLLSLVALYTCTPRLVLPTFDAQSYLRGISDHGATFGFLDKEALEQLVKCKRGHREDISTLTTIAVVQKEEDEESVQGAARKLNVTCCNAYLKREMTSIVAVQAVRDTALSFGSVGRLAPNTRAVIIDCKGKSLSSNEWGQLLLQGPQLVPKNAGISTRSSPQDDTHTGTWLHTGDTARIDEAGYLFIQGKDGAGV